MYAKWLVFSEPMSNLSRRELIVLVNFLAPPHNRSSTKQTMSPIRSEPSYQANIPWSSSIGVALRLTSSSLSLRYQLLLASLSPYMVLFNFHTWLVLASFGGRTYTSRSIGRPCKNAVLTSSPLSCHFIEAMMVRAILIPSQEHVGLSLRMSRSSWKPRAHRRALTDGLSSISLGLQTHRRVMRSWSSNLTSE